MSEAVSDLQPMSGVRVVELCSFVSGPFCGRLLSDFGAQVIKIEQPRSGDESRRYGPFPGDKTDPEASGLFLYLNTNKQSVTLDIATPEGAAVFKKLITDADILIEDRSPGELDKLNLGYEQLRAINPALIMTSITPYGQTGPFRDYRAHHLNIYHASGQGYLLPMWSKDLNREPVKGPGYLGDYDGGMSAAIATLSALFWRGAGGTGQHIDISRQEAMLHLDRGQLRRFVDSGENPNRTGKGRLLEQLVQCRDGSYVVLILSSQSQWVGLVEAMGRPDWAFTEQFNTQAARSANVEALVQRLSDWAKNEMPQDIFESIQRNGSACAPVQTAEAFYHSPQIEARGYLEDIEHPHTGVLRYPGLPYQFSNTPPGRRQRAPMLGEHNSEILGSLGYSQNDIEQFAKAGVV